MAFIDHVGQHDRLDKLSALAMSGAPGPDLEDAVRDSAGKVKTARDLFKKWFEGFMAQPPSKDVPTEFHERILELRSFPYGMLGFSDTIVVSASFGRADVTMAGYRLFVFLCSVAMMMLNCLALGIPLRAGLDVGLAIGGLFPQEVYGPVLPEAHKLESTVARWPRAAIGQGLIDYLEHLHAHSSDAASAHVLSDCRSLIRNDPKDGVQMLHILSKSIVDRLDTIPDVAYGWVSTQHAKFVSSGNDKLLAYYERLAEYFREHGYNDARAAVALDRLTEQMARTQVT